MTNELKYLDGTGLSQVWNKVKQQLGTKTDTTTTTAIDTRLKTVETELPKKAAKATTLSGYGITDAYTKTEIDGKLTGAMQIKGSVDTYASLPTSPAKGDTYLVKTADPSHGVEAGEMVMWDGSAWQDMGGSVDLSGYYTKTETDTKLNNKVDKVSGKQLSTNDYTTDEKNKLAGIAAGAQVNVIEKITVNGVAATVSGKAATVTIPVPNMVALTSGEIDAIIV